MRIFQLLQPRQADPAEESYTQQIDCRMMDSRITAAGGRTVGLRLSEGWYEVVAEVAADDMNHLFRITQNGFPNEYEVWASKSFAKVTSGGTLRRTRTLHALQRRYPKLTSIEQVGLPSMSAGDIVFSPDNGEYWLCDYGGWTLLAKDGQEFVAGPHAPREVQHPDTF